MIRGCIVYLSPYIYTKEQIVICVIFCFALISTLVCMFSAVFLFTVHTNSMMRYRNTGCCNLWYQLFPGSFYFLFSTQKPSVYIFLQIINPFMKKTKIDNTVLPFFYTKLSQKNISFYDFMNEINTRCKILKNIETNNIDDVSLLEDSVSHFCLRLVCSQSMFAKKWFLKLETELMNKKLKKLKESHLIKVFLYVLKNLSNIKKTNNNLILNWNSKFKFNEMEDQQKLNDPENYASFTKIGQTSVFENLFDENQPDLSAVSDDELLNMLNNGYISAHFTKGINVLHDLELKSGFFVIDKKSTVIISIIINIYNKFLDERVTTLYEKSKLESDERLLKIHNNLFKSDTPTCKGSTLLQINDFFPPCIDGLLKKLKRVNHLKYKDRLVLTRFFKDSGLSVQECIFLFKNNFKDIDEEKFNKEYLYSIRHSYGLEGKRASYHSYSCQQMIEMCRDRETFGCPFVNNTNFVGDFSRQRNIEFNIEDAPIKSCCNALKALTKNETIEMLTTPLQFFKTYQDSMNAHMKVD